MIEIAHSDLDILGGRPVFKGTRVPVAVLFSNLADGLPLDEILNSYPTLSREMAKGALHAICQSLDHWAQDTQAGQPSALCDLLGGLKGRSLKE